MVKVERPEEEVIEGLKRDICMYCCSWLERSHPAPTEIIGIITDL
jgi:hypothetical protein